MDLTRLPGEVLHQIFLHLPPVTILSLESVCKKFKAASGSLLWRHFCKAYYQHWEVRHNIAEKFAGSLDASDWKILFRNRFLCDRRVIRSLDRIIDHPSDRTAKFEAIADEGWDAKDALLRQCNADPFTGDGLARAWYSRAAIGSVHRFIAISQWRLLISTSQDYAALETALLAFDLFVAGHTGQSWHQAGDTLDSLAQEFRQACPQFAGVSDVEKAKAVASFVRDRNLVGINEAENQHYHDMPNNFMATALANDEHPSLPLISVAIFCSVAQRLGIDARPCAFPFHVLAMVMRPDQGPLYFDPFRQSTEVDLEDLRSQLTALRVPLAEHEHLLGYPAPFEIVSRCARNIMTSVQKRPESVGSEHEPLSLESALYASMWVLMLSHRNFEEEGALQEQLQRLSDCSERLQILFPHDVWIMQRYVVPQYEEAAPRVAQMVDAVRHDIDSPKIPKLRSSIASRTVRYHVGQVFVHARYQYHAVIIGWDVQCSASDYWIARNRVDDLAKGRSQSFYESMVEDGSTRYVAEENIKIVEQGAIPKLLELGGRYFKRYDKSSKAFISNIVDEYPDD